MSSKHHALWLAHFEDWQSLTRLKTPTIHRPVTYSWSTSICLNTSFSLQFSDLINLGDEPEKRRLKHSSQIYYVAGGICNESIFLLPGSNRIDKRGFLERLIPVIRHSFVRFRYLLCPGAHFLERPNQLHEPS